MSPGVADLLFRLSLLVLGLTAIIGTNTATSGTKQDRAQQQDLRGADYTDNRVDGNSKEVTLPFYYNNNFDCNKHQYSYGMYADMDFHCQVYHVCHNNRKETFLCPSGTLFNQMLLVCDHWHSVNCQNTPSFYYVNEELGKVSNRTRFDSRDRPYSQRRFPQDTSDAHGQFPPYYSRNTQSPFHRPPIEEPHGQNGFSNHTQTGRYNPQQLRGQQLDRENQLASGYGYGASPNNIRGQQGPYGQQRPGIGERGSLQGVQQPPTSFPPTQQNRGLVFTHYSQSGARRTDRNNRTDTTWQIDQRNTSQVFQYGRQPSWSYPESSLLGSRYGGQRSFTAQPDRATPGSPLHTIKPPVSEDGHLTSQLPTAGFSYHRQLPSSGSQGQGGLDRGFRPGLSSGNAENVQHSQQQPQPGSPGLPYRPHHPFTTHGGQIHPQARSPAPSYDHQQPTDYEQQPPQGRGAGSGYGHQHSTSPPNRGEQPHFGTTVSYYTRNEQRQPYTTSGPVYGQQHIVTDGRLSTETGGLHQGAGTVTGEGPHRNSTQLRGHQNFATGHRPHTSGTKPEFGYTSQASDHQQEGKPDSKTIQSPQSWSQPTGNQPQRSQHGSQETVRYGWQKPGNPYYSFQQPQYRNLPLPRITASHLSSGSIGNSTGYNGSGAKNLKPILVYQHHIPVSINGNTTGGTNNTGAGRQGVPVYKVYYVRGDRKEIAAN